MTKESESWEILVDSDGYVVGFKDEFWTSERINAQKHFKNYGK
jgi:hypothetical protein